MGNTAVLEQLKDWLAEWKKIMQKDIKKACKRSASQTSKSKGRGMLRQMLHIFMCCVSYLFFFCKYPLELRSIPEMVKIFSAYQGTC